MRRSDVDDLEIEVAQQVVDELGIEHVVMQRPVGRVLEAPLPELRRGPRGRVQRQVVKLQNLVEMGEIVLPTSLLKSSSRWSKLVTGRR